MKREKKLLRPSEQVAEEIKLAPGETQETRFADWLATLLTTPRFCSKHPRTQLVHDPCWNGIGEGRRGYGAKFEPPSFTFRAAFRCAACRRAYALCPPQFHETNFANFDTSTPERVLTLARSREFVAQVNQFHRGFAAFLGGTGNGKTTLACAMVPELDNSDALYTRQGQITVALRASYGRKEVILHRYRGDDESDDDTPPTPLEITQGVGFLILDEIGCAPLANDERLFLDELLKTRYDEGKPTVLISNLPLDAFKVFMGDALADRITHATGNKKFLLQFAGESFRRAGNVDYLAGPPAVHADPAPVREVARPRPVSAQERFHLDKELAEVRERQAALYEAGAPPDAQDEKREREIEARLKAS